MISHRQLFTYRNSFAKISSQTSSKGIKKLKGDQSIKASITIPKKSINQIKSIKSISKISLEHKPTLDSRFSELSQSNQDQVRNQLRFLKRYKVLAIQGKEDSNQKRQTNNIQINNTEHKISSLLRIASQKAIQKFFLNKFFTSEKDLIIKNYQKRSLADIGLNLLYKNEQFLNFDKVVNILNLSTMTSLKVKVSSKQKDKHAQQIVNELLDCLQKSKYLQDINIELTGSSFQIEDKEMEVLSKAIAKKHNLKAFSLSIVSPSSHITKFGIEAIMSSLKLQQQSIKIFNLHIHGKNNQVEDDSMQKIAYSIQNCLNLEQISVKFNNRESKITDKGLQYLIMGISQCLALKSIALQFYGTHNYITDLTLLNLGSVIQNLFKLESIYLDFSEGENCITEKGLLTLASGFSKSRKLKSFGIDVSEGCNKFDANGLIQFIDQFKLISSLEELYLCLYGHENDKIESIKLLFEGLKVQKKQLFY